LKDDFNLPVAPAHSIRHAFGICDDVIDQIGRSILSELTVETSASRMYVEAASVTLAARLLQKHCDSGACMTTESSAHSLDHTRLRRVLEYINANLQNDITLENLAGVAGYSVFHFARKFTLDEKRGCVVSRSGQQERSKQAQAGKRRGPLPHACLLIHSVQ